MTMSRTMDIEATEYRHGTAHGTHTDTQIQTHTHTGEQDKPGDKPQATDGARHSLRFDWWPVPESIQTRTAMSPSYLVID